jgi:hypothetical protein
MISAEFLAFLLTLQQLPLFSQLKAFISGAKAPTSKFINDNWTL